MSTEHQQYSLENQSAAILEYAESHGFDIVHTYTDAAKSGVVLKHRVGLRQLLHDVVAGDVLYRAILVYDVSRWGRFQDTDEAAHYEFLCKSAGVRVHYCAETFSNDDALSSMIMKSLKRVMAGEYSRELGVKVLAGQRRGATLGFRQGAQPGYGLRRLLVSADRLPKQFLAQGERKSIATDRTILVPGSSTEVQCVREIYRMFIRKRMTFSEIARALNRRRIKYIEDSKWSLRAVETILTHPKYIGCNVYGRYTQRLYTPPKETPRSEWTVTPGAFQPLVDPTTYAKAQRIIATENAGFPRNKSDDDLLDALRAIRARKGRITTELIKDTPKTPSAQTYNTRFGTLSHAYELIGYSGFWRGGWLETRRRIQALRSDLMRQIVDLNPTRLSVENRGGSYRTRLRMQDGRLISVLASRPLRCYKDAIRWILTPRPDECCLTTLVARLNLKCDAFKDMFVIPPLDRPTPVYVKDSDPRLQMGVRLMELKDFYRTIEQLGDQGYVTSSGCTTLPKQCHILRVKLIKNYPDV
jgi:DNA invertase Pin-like site-specific DNA recombinase